MPKSSIKPFVQYFAWGREPQDRTAHPDAKFHRYSFKNMALRSPKSPKMVIFGKNLPLGKNSGG